MKNNHPLTSAPSVVHCPGHPAGIHGESLMHCNWAADSDLSDMILPMWVPVDDTICSPKLLNFDTLSWVFAQSPVFHFL